MELFYFCAQSDLFQRRNLALTKLPYICIGKTMEC